MKKNILYWASIVLLALSIYLTVSYDDSNRLIAIAGVTTAIGFALNILAHYLVKNDLKI